MASFTSLVVLFCVMIMSVIYVDATVNMLNGKTCAVREDPITYIPNEYECKFQATGLYIFEERSPSTVKKLSMDRLTDLSVLNIHQGTGLEMIYLAEGSCEQIKAPVDVEIWVAGGSYLNAPKVVVHPLPSPAGSSGTIPNLYNFVPVVEITTDDHEEITKPMHVDQTTVDEISKPSSEKSTMKTSISSQQYGSTSTQHNVSSEPTGIDSENDVDTTPWIISTKTVIAVVVTFIIIIILIWRKKRTSINFDAGSEEIIFEQTRKKSMEKND